MLNHPSRREADDILETLDDLERAAEDAMDLWARHGSQMLRAQYLRAERAYQNALDSERVRFGWFAEVV